jgi:hypothetical protein
VCRGLVKTHQSADAALRAQIIEVLRDCDLKVNAYLGKTSIMGSILSSASISDQVAAARPKLEKAPPRKTSVRLICSTKITNNLLKNHDNIKNKSGLKIANLRLISREKKQLVVIMQH